MQDAVGFLRQRLAFNDTNLVPLDADGRELHVAESIARLKAFRLSQRYGSSSNIHHVQRMVPKEAVAGNAFNPRAPDQLKIVSGERVSNITALDDVWWFGEQRGRRGRFPRWLVEEINDLIFEAEVLRLSGAEWDLAWRYIDGSGGVEQNGAYGLTLMTRAANQRNPDAILALGTIYRDGKCVEKDPEKALAYYRDAANCALSVGQDVLADCYSEGLLGLPRDIEKSLHWRRLAAAQGYHHALYSLGVSYFKGTGVPRDRVQSYGLILRAAMQGNPDAMELAGECFRIGTGVPKDHVKAAEWFRLALANGCVSAKVALGLLYMSGYQFPKDETRAYALFKEAADQGERKGYYQLAIMHSNGSGCPKDLKLSFELFKKAADMGLPSAQYRVAACYWNASGVERDMSQAFQWCLKAAEKDNDVAQLQLGHCHYYGYGTAKNMALAAEWYRRAIENHNSDAKVSLADIYLNPEVPGTADFPAALALFREAAEEGNVEAMRVLGHLYLEGRANAIMPDEDEAIMWFQRGAANSETDSQYQLEKLCRKYVGQGKQKL